MQAAPQRSCVEVHGAEHTPAAQMRSAAQAWPHMPQLTLSVRGSTHRAPHSRLGAAHTEASVVVSGRQSPMRHAKPAPQVTPQAPQLAGSYCAFTQRPLQLICVAVQAPAQAPPVQTWPAAQVVPQAPQLATLVLVSTQRSPHRVVPVGQPGWQTPSAQS